MRAELVILEGDPASDVGNFVRVRTRFAGPRNIPSAIAEQEGSASPSIRHLK
jgi:hypothetical protein